MTVARFWRGAVVMVLLAGSGVSADAVEEAPLGLLPRDQAVPPDGGIFGSVGGLRPGSDPFSLLGLPEVQRDLGLTDDQIGALRRANPLFRNRIEGLAHGGGGMSAADFERVLWTSRGAIANVLTPAQQDRFQQIALQIGGPCLIAGDSPLQRALAIGDESRRQLADACKGLAERLQAAFRHPAAGEDPCPGLRANRQRLQRMVDEGEAAIRAQLTAEQRQRLQELEGNAIRINPPVSPQCPAEVVQANGYGQRANP